MAGILQLNLTAMPFQNTAPSNGVLVLEQPLLRLWKSEAEEGTEIEPLAIKARPNVLLYIVDTVRADHIGLYGYERPVSPRVDAFADRSIAFMDAVAQTPWTRASVASILTGLYPDNHHTNSGEEKLAEDFLTLAEVLSGKGYETAALVTNGNLAPEFGLGQGFDTYVHLKERGVEVHRRAEELHAKAISWLGERSKERPFFLYVHATDPHAPYTPPAEFQEEFAPNLRYPEASSLQVITGLFKGELQADDDLREDLVNLYDAEIAYWDHEFGNLLDHLERAGLADNTIVVLVSDHGEEFAEHGRWQHSTSVHSELIQVPLVIRLPLGWGAGTQVTSPVQHVDIFPTLLDLLSISGEEVKVRLDGRSLVPDIGGAEVPVADVRSSLRTRSRIITDCAVGSRFKLIRHWSDVEPTSHLLFDRTRDPGELRDIARHNPITVEFFRRQLSSVVIDPGSLPRAEMESETRDALKALGYID
jgi:arylsulfatase A-like enzyme